MMLCNAFNYKHSLCTSGPGCMMILYQQVYVACGLGYVSSHHIVQHIHSLITKVSICQHYIASYVAHLVVFYK